MNIVVLTGAGISAESGIPVFRGADGLWEGHRVEDVATPEGFARDPQLVHEFYNRRRAKLLEVKPNAAHGALARLERELDGQLTLITQNIDDLHERAGSREVIHMHGELLKARCRQCGAVVAWREDLSRANLCKACGGMDSMRPHVVWFGEMPFHLGWIERELNRADLFVAIGTSGQVYPAAGFVGAAKESGARTLEINLDPGGTSRDFDEHRTGLASEQVPAWVDECLGKR
ncbi:NAD-dependent deacetylase [Haloferula luteola]|uniref:NAD-dependent protein deacylase n=1 Tax=Haloferula luteola TaxID=595692 RepID=A0A840V8T1_9BACT|nr:Sir2 family NAD+-dependent deacetylase [Haloferula luteola]MBB5350189.1 NAD-dependent deacetylase [Haloferula luteola]